MRQKRKHKIEKGRPSKAQEEKKKRKRKSFSMERRKEHFLMPIE